MDGAARGNKGQGAPSNGAASRRLRSWKEIAAYFGTDERTVKRWEARGLPVQRVPGGARTPVYADTHALEQWIGGRGAAAPSAAPEPLSTPDATRTARKPLLAALGILLALIMAASAWMTFRDEVDPAPPARHQPAQRAVDLYTAATYQAERATPESMKRAISLYGQAIGEDPAYAEAFAGLAGAYIKLRLFAAVSEAEAYPRAKAAAQRALELDPNLSQAHSAIGYVSFYSDWDFGRGLHHFAEAVRLDPRSASGHYQYAMALLHAGEPASALRELEASQRLDPRARGILADKGFVLYLLGRRDEGLALIRQVVANDPDYMLSHQYLSLIHLSEGAYRPGLDEAEAVARLRQDKDRLAEAAPTRRALAEGGAPAMFRTVLAAKEKLYASGREPAYVVAEMHALAGNRAEALRYLKQSIAAREPLALTLRIDPLLRGLHGDPEFRQLATGIGMRQIVDAQSARP